MFFWHLQGKQLRQRPGPLHKHRARVDPDLGVLNCRAPQQRWTRTWGEATAEKIASPIVSSTSRDRHREFRGEWEFGASTGLRGPEALTLGAEVREQHPHAAEWEMLPAPAKGLLAKIRHIGSLTMQGPGEDNQVLLRPSSSHLAYSKPETTFTSRWDNKEASYSQLKENDHLLLSTTQVFVSLYTTSAKAIFQGTKLRFYYCSLQVDFGKAVEK